ncbi:MAG: hypothetical protein AABX37_05295 [Nanoarchaeota archaeon]
MRINYEAAYLYVYSKKLLKVNKRIKALTHNAEKHKLNHLLSKTERHKQKHQKKHARATKAIHELLKDHHELLKRLRHHYLNFAHALQKEMKQK